ncbi:Fimbrial adhesin subunit [Salmonella enterica subsp. enterica serovar Typhi str. P-stx-12]|nr:Fimbrial adhesin subunit [Salmonella enterica subsp. enterica serovar Typhi str. P-stx-12]AXR55823.1 putative membrane protein [Salmonella enterica subsp. enterica serovar Typhi]
MEKTGNQIIQVLVWYLILILLMNLIFIILGMETFPLIPI